MERKLKLTEKMVDKIKILASIKMIALLLGPNPVSVNSSYSSLIHKGSPQQAAPRI